MQPAIPRRVPRRAFRGNSLRTRSIQTGRLPARATARRPAGFTLLELLIAISIIGILAGLLLTAGASVMRRSREAQVSVDIQNLVQAIAQFKQTFGGNEPPSRISLYENPINTNPGASTDWSGDPRSMGLIRQLWPQFDFTIARDINGDSDTTDSFTITGAECLVFFLGGVPQISSVAGTGGGPPMGFSPNPANPFDRTSTTNRQSFITFDASRLYIYPSATAPTQANKFMNAYRDTLAAQTQPYLYLSSYGGQGYDVANELLGNPPGGNVPAGNNFVDVYRQGPNGYGSASPSPPWNANGFQIISPGGDTYYGAGGEYETANGSTLLIGTRSGERDNITNFSSGILAP